MASWHQSKNPAGLAGLWTPDPVTWKCVADKPGGFASCMSFATEAEARAYAGKTGDVVLPPARPHKT